MTPALTCDGKSAATVSKEPPVVGWRRIVLLVALLNAPLFFQGCQSQRMQFTLGPVVPFAQVESEDQRPWFPARLVAWSWLKLLANFSIVSLGVWVARRRFTWIRRMAASRWLPAILLLVAVVFDVWLIWPWGWEYLVWAPQMQLCNLVVKLVQIENPSETTQWRILLLSGRLYYVLLVTGLSLSFLIVRLFLRRYFFVRTGPRWRIQLGGLIVVVIVLGTAIGMTVRLLLQN